MQRGSSGSLCIQLYPFNGMLQWMLSLYSYTNMTTISCLDLLYNHHRCNINPKTFVVHFFFVELAPPETAPPRRLNFRGSRNNESVKQGQ